MTTNKGLITLSGVVALLVPLSLQAATTNHGNVTVAQEARETLSEIQGTAIAAAGQAQQLESLTLNPDADAEGQLSPLLNLKDELNRIGQKVSTLDAERDSLAPWEKTALDKVRPLLAEAARNTESAIQFFNDNKPHLWNHEYRDQVAKIEDDSQEAAKDLRAYLKYDKVREEARELRNSFGAGSD